MTNKQEIPNMVVFKLDDDFYSCDVLEVSEDLKLSNNIHEFISTYQDVKDSNIIMVKYNKLTSIGTELNRFELGKNELPQSVKDAFDSGELREIIENILNLNYSQSI